MAPLRFLNTLIFLIIVQSIHSQIPDSQLVFSWVGIDYGNETVSQVDKDLLENRIRSFLLEISRQEAYSLTVPNDLELFRKALLSKGQNFQNLLSGVKKSPAQAYIMAQVKLTPSIILTMTLHDPSTGEIIASNTKNFKDFSQLTYTLQDQTYDLFGLPSPNISLSNTGPNPNIGGKLNQISFSDIQGIWKGDFDIQEVNVKADGTGIAKLQNGETFKLKIKIEDGAFICTQDEPNSAKLYLGTFPLTIASQIVKLARPMSWKFTINTDRNQLVGIKYTSHFTIERGQIIQTNNSYSREALWIRIP